MATATSKSAARKAGILDQGYLAQSAIGEGHLVSHGAAEGEVILPAGATDVKLAGVSMSGGSSGGTATAGTDMVDVQWNGVAKCKLKTTKVANRGDLAVPADSTGACQARTLYSFSQAVVGTFDQTKTAGTSDDFIQVDMSPRIVEIVRSVFASSSSTLGANTKYILPGYVAVGSAAIQVYACAFTNQTIRNLVATLLTAPGGTDTAQFVIMKSSDQGATWAATALTCTITGTAKTATDLTHTAVLAQYDMLAVQIISSATTAAVPTCQFDVT